MVLSLGTAENKRTHVNKRTRHTLERESEGEQNALITLGEIRKEGSVCESPR